MIQLQIEDSLVASETANRIASEHFVEERIFDNDLELSKLIFCLAFDVIVKPRRGKAIWVLGACAAPLRRSLA